MSVVKTVQLTIRAFKLTGYFGLRSPFIYAILLFARFHLLVVFFSLFLKILIFCYVISELDTFFFIFDVQPIGFPGKLYIFFHIGKLNVILTMAKYHLSVT